ncbi:MAG: 2-succinyl-5-enolpyruvyl-6-hydroxy-3-cyclohexene-carboxylate synthase [Anaerocolumna sp.]|jgi:2-succinyl-5-enolpyruvyl-6-hydroxy-3-cyclohexene-1-carboxylate synthase|nr:2-succinyl-5-enolpyruvyl-6-hydroxy-3-cyclohexene-carboxylate synthase [Anaerocolumna sp.]
MPRYTTERNAQIVIQLLKDNNIKKIVASPGTTNACLVASLQSDSHFEIYSAPEERVGAYMACGLADESGEPVVLSCTGATASRNYMPALTEAYYRKLPILAITSSRRSAFIGHNMDQVTDRTAIPNDIANLSVQLPVVHDEISEWQCIINANKAILELKHHGGGPVHINLETMYSTEYEDVIAPVRRIERFTQNDNLPKLGNQKVVIMVGNHKKWTQKLVDAVDKFCATYDSVVLCDHTSKYYGKYRVFASLLSSQSHWKSSFQNVDIMIHIGDVSTSDFQVNAQYVWRVNPDGNIRDTFRKVQYVFEMEEELFFEHYSNNNENKSGFLECCKSEAERLLKEIPELPFSNIWLASILANKLPKDSVLHLGIRNSLRSWNLFDTNNSVCGYSNTGGFGIDGSISTVVGAALAHPDKMYYCVLGDLAFFYDISVFGNRHFPGNIRILLVNNSIGFEMKGNFTLGKAIASKMDVDESKFIAAGGHYQHKINGAVKHFVEDFGCKYYCAENKEQFIEYMEDFLSESKDKSIVFEAFVTPENEDEAFALMCNLVGDNTKGVKSAFKNLLGQSAYDSLKKAIKGK